MEIYAKLTKYQRKHVTDFLSESYIEELINQVPLTYYDENVKSCISMMIDFPEALMWMRKVTSYESPHDAYEEHLSNKFRCYVCFSKSRRCSSCHMYNEKYKKLEKKREQIIKTAENRESEFVYAQIGRRYHISYSDDHSFYDIDELIGYIQFDCLNCYISRTQITNIKYSLQYMRENTAKTLALLENKLLRCADEHELYC